MDVIHSKVDAVNAVDDRQGPLVVLYFDEAHELHETSKDGTSPVDSQYARLCWTLDLLTRENMFSVFLSTNSNLSHFAPTLEDHPSKRNRSDIMLQPPFTEMPFGMPEYSVNPSELRLEVMKSEQFMAKLGRPL
jgi:hypothetical protein